MAIVTIGIDLAKNVFAVHGVDDTGKPALVRPDVARGKRGKNDAADAAAIAEAVTRPNMRFVPVKSIDQRRDLPLGVDAQHLRMPRLVAVVGVKGQHMRLERKAFFKRRNLHLGAEHAQRAGTNFHHAGVVIR